MTKNETRLDSFYTEFESSQVELRATCLAHKFRVLVPGLFKYEEGTMGCGMVLRDEPIVSANGTVLSQSCNML
jgi:hypothetical protein